MFANKIEEGQEDFNSRLSFGHKSTMAITGNPLNHSV
jgi:hypothetical protein